MRISTSALLRGPAAVVAVAAVALAPHAARALPQGAALFVTTLTCPSGWSEVTTAQGRLVVSVADAAQGGTLVGKPLTDQEDRVHAHAVATGITLPSKHVAAAGGCCNGGGGGHGYFDGDGQATDASASGAPFQQLLLCEKDAGDEAPVPFGTVVYFTPASVSAAAAAAARAGDGDGDGDGGGDGSVTGDSGCPVGFAAFDDATGRVLVPSSHSGPPVASPDAPLSAGEDRAHSHTLNVSVDVAEIGYAAIEGCCNSGPAASGTYTNTTVSAAASHGLPYIQLLTCYSTTPTFNSSSLAPGALVFTTGPCVAPWQPSVSASGRFVVATPSGGQSGTSFGGPALSVDADPPPVVGHQHTYSGSVSVPVNEVVAAGGPSGGYAGNGAFPYSGTSTLESTGLPYILTTVCEYAGAQSAAAAAAAAAVDAAAAAAAVDDADLAAGSGAAGKAVAADSATPVQQRPHDAAARPALRGSGSGAAAAETPGGDTALWPYPPKLPSVGFMGRSYDVVKGNPRADLVDPGWVLSVPILNLTYNSHSTTRDGRWEVPDNVDALPMEACSYQGSSSTVHDMHSYRHNLRQDIAFKDRFLDFSFSASAQYRKMEHTTTYMSQVVTSVSASCSTYKIGQLPNIPVPVSASFAEGVAALPLRYSHAEYFAFVDNYGTHFASNLLMGGKTVRQCTLSEEEYTNLTTTGVNVATGAALEFMGFHGSTKVSHDSHSADYERFSQFNASCAQQCMPTCAPIYDARSSEDPFVDAGLWQKQVNANPFPVQYTLTPLSDLLTPTHFPTHNASELAIKRSQLDMYVQESYCAGLNGTGLECTSPLSEGYWMSYRVMPVQRSAHVVTSLGNTVYVLGGLGASFAPLASVQSFDPAVNVWADLAPLPEARAAAVGVAFPDSNSIVVAGGWADRSAAILTLTRVDQYFPALDQWRSLPNMTVARQSAAGVRFGNTLVVSGGCSFEPGVAACTQLASVESLSLATLQWTQLNPLATARSHHGALVLSSSTFSSLLFAVGGQLAGTGSGATASCEFYDLKTQASMPCPYEMPVARSSFAMVSGDNATQAFVLGGLDEAFLPQTDVLMFEVRNATWTSKRPLVSPRSSFQAAWVLDFNDDADGVESVFAVGGNSGAAAALDVLEVMDPELNA